MVLLDCLLYALLTISPLLSLVAATLLFFVRRRAMRSGQAVWEKRVYVAVMVGGMVVWGWNALRPPPSIFEERFGLYWGWKADNMDAAVFSPVDRSAKIAYRGTTSLIVSFGKEAGWLILHHFPMPPAADRYSELEFYIRKTDLKHDRLRVCLYGEGKQQCPRARASPLRTRCSSLPPTAKSRAIGSHENSGFPLAGRRHHRHWHREGRRRRFGRVLPGLHPPSPQDPVTLTFSHRAGCLGPRG